MISKLRILPLLVLLPAAALLFFPVHASAQKKATAKKTADTFLNGVPFTFEQVFRFIQENAIPPRRQREAIQNRGVDFAPTPDLLEKLRAAGAPDDLIELISWRGKPLPKAPAVPPPPKTGEVQLTCAPAECEVSIGGVAKGSSSNGALRIPDVPPGSAAVDVKRAGYVGAQAVVTVEAGKTASVAVKLEPDRATQESFGESLYKQMVKALGGDAAVHEALSIQAEGSATVWTRAGGSTRWSVFLRNKPDRALIQASGGGGVLYEIAFVGSQFKTSKNMKGDDARELPNDFGLLRDHQLAGLIALLNTPKFKMLSIAPAKTPDQDLTLTAEGSTETISITLDNDSRPAQVKFGTATGLGGAIVTYSDYAKHGATFYPQSMQIKPDATPHGIDVHFDKVDLNPKLKDSDYNLRGKSLAR